MKGLGVWYDANGLSKVKEIETLSRVLNPCKLDNIKRQLLFEGETMEMAAERDGLTVEWMNTWIEEQYQHQVKIVLGWVPQWVLH